MEYTLGESTLQFGPYSFVQTPACQHPYNVTVEKPAFVSHDDIAKVFKVSKTSDVSLVGLYTIKVTYSVRYRTSLTDPSVTTTVLS